MSPTQSFRYFDWLDYSVFGLLLTGSVCIGIYFGFLSKRKQNTKLEYLLGSRELPVFPLAMSLTATQMSAVALLGLPAEIYTFGTQLWAMVLPDFFIGPILAYWFVPVFYNLDKTSMYEYLNKRFSPSVRTLGSILFLVKMILVIPIMMYGPSLALAQVTGLPLSAIIAVTCLVCTFYTTFGGMKAVVWTDTLQVLVIAACSVLMVIIGTIENGGFSSIIEIARKGDRLEFFNMSMDPTIRLTFWNVSFAFGIFRFAYHTCNQGAMQRFLASSTLPKAQASVGVFVFLYFVLTNFMFYIGVVVYASFADCDPLTAGQVRKPDQLVPYFVMTTIGHIPALPGIFMSAVFSASLSTMSTNLNSMSAVILEDLVQPLTKKPITEHRASIIMKSAAVLLGVIITALAYIAENLSGLVEGVSTVSGIVIGGLMGLLILGLFLPWANSYGALAGTLCSLGLVSWMGFGQQVALYNKRIVNPAKPISIAGCNNNTLERYNNMKSVQTVANFTVGALHTGETPLYLYRISYTYYTVIGVVTVLTVGMLVSYCTGLNNPRHMDPKLFSPAIRRFLPKPTVRRRPADGGLTRGRQDGDQNMALIENTTKGNR